MQIQFEVSETRQQLIGNSLIIAQGWPDHGVPENISGVAGVLEEMEVIGCVLR